MQQTSSQDMTNVGRTDGQR